MWHEDRVWVDPDPDAVRAIEDPTKRVLAAHRALLANEVVGFELRRIRQQAILELTERRPDRWTDRDIAPLLGLHESRVNKLRRPPSDRKVRQMLTWPIPERDGGPHQAHADPGPERWTSLDADHPPGWVLGLG